MDEIKNNCRRALMALEGLIIYRALAADPLLEKFKTLLTLAMGGESSAPGSFSDLLGSLLHLEECDNLPDIDIWQNHLLNLLLSAENYFTLKCGEEETEAMDALLLRSVRSDLRLLKVLYDFNLAGLAHSLKEQDAPEGLYDIPDDLKRGNCCSVAGYPPFYFQKRIRVKKTLAISSDWSKEMKVIHGFYRATGSGMFGRYWAFRWNGRGEKTGLTGVSNPDSINPEDLVGYEEQKKEILRNTAQFVGGFGANNMLLYGDRGTGKSSTIKSMLHIFGERGLRIIEVARQDLLNLPRIIAVVANRPQRFIIFIDDLSFEEEETGYKELKALLEGSIEKPPVNVLVYATSNRRNVVREYFSDRETDEVGKQDTYQEKLSLADRFGIKLVYAGPDEKEYLRTVDDMAAKRGISIPQAELHDLALRWAQWHNARSGRTARQFIDDLCGRLKMQDKPRFCE